MKKWQEFLVEHSNEFVAADAWRKELREKFSWIAPERWLEIMAQLEQSHPDATFDEVPALIEAVVQCKSK